jgi:hypothetical protein
VTSGSTFTIRSTDAGLESFSGKTRVFAQIGHRLVSVQARTTNDDSGDALACRWMNNAPIGIYDLFVETTADDGRKAVTKITDLFAVVPPAVHSVSSSTAGEGETLTINGSMFGPRCRIFLDPPGGVGKSCRILTKRSEIMEPDTGKSSVEIVVPAAVDSVNGMTVRIENPVGTDVEMIDDDLASASVSVYVVNVGDLHETSKYLSKMANFIKTFRTTHSGMTVTLNAGDLLSSYGRTAYDPDWARDLYTPDPDRHGVVMMAAMTATPFDAIAVGNHDPCLGIERLLELLKIYPIPVLGGNLFSYFDTQYRHWQSSATVPSPISYRILNLKGLDVGVVVTASTIQDHWTDSDKSAYRVLNTLDATTIRNIRICLLHSDLVILITHQSDVSDIIPVYGKNPQPTGSYLVNSDIYSIKDLKKVSLVIGGHEHKNYFRRASYSGDNETYSLYQNPIYNPDSDLVLVKSSKFYGEYVGVVRFTWDRDATVVRETSLMEGVRDEFGKYIGCAANQMMVVKDAGVIQELDESPWDPTVPSRWWRMDDWPGTDAEVDSILRPAGVSSPVLDGSRQGSSPTHPAGFR